MAPTNLAAIVPINPLYRRPVVEQATGFSRSTLYLRIKNGLFTKPVVIGTDKRGKASQVAWPCDEVQQIINARIAGKTDAEIKLLVCKLEAARGEK